MNSIISLMDYISGQFLILLIGFGFIYTIESNIIYLKKCILLVLN